MSALEKAKNLLANNGKVTIQEKGNPYDVWVFSLRACLTSFKFRQGRVK